MYTGLILGFVFIIALGVMASFFRSFQVRKTTTSEKKIDIKKDLQNFKKNFQSLEDKKVLINDLDLIEYFNKFPFLSEFKEVFKRYQNEEMLEGLLKTQTSFYNYWANKEYDFFVHFENLSKRDLIIFSSTSLIKIYREFSIMSFNIFEEKFIYKVLPSTIAKFQKINYKKIVYSDIDDFIDLQFTSFCQKMDKVMETIEDSFSASGSQKRQYNQNTNNEDSNAEKLAKAYKILGSSPYETDDQIKKAYLKLAKKYHPDKNSDPNAKKKMVEINNAYEIIQENRKRK